MTPEEARKTLKEKLSLHWWNGDDQYAVAKAIRTLLDEIERLEKEVK